MVLLLDPLDPVAVPASDAMSGVVAVVFVIYLLFILVGMALGITCYVLQSFGMYTIAERRGIRNAWLAWVPGVNMWVLGSISDQYQYLTKGKIKNRRKTLVALMILEVVTYFAMIIGIVIAAISAPEEMSPGVALAMVLCAIAVIAVLVALYVIVLMCYYDLFRSCEPGSAVLYLVLSIFISAALPIVVFICRKKDLGMPKRKDPNAQTVAEIPATEVLQQEEEAPAEEEPQELPPAEEGYANPEEFEDEEKQ